MEHPVVHIVSFDIPYPADYGGIIDIFFKLKALRQNGFGIILHCFQYKKEQQAELEKYCEKVYYYPRRKGLRYLLCRKPYIVATREDELLLQRLTADTHPVLFEGLHTCALLDAPELKSKKKLVRTHNIEHQYYSGLRRSARPGIKKLYYAMESHKLRRFEGILRHADCLVSISPNDTAYFRSRFQHTEYVPAFHPFNQVHSQPGQGRYFLFHGKLSVEENNKAALFLLDRVFNNSKTKLIIAGRAPGKLLRKKSAQMANITLMADPDEEQMAGLLANAQACILPTFQATGLKLKLLISLFSSRFVIANPPMVENTGMEALCQLAQTPEEFKTQINQLSGLEFTGQMLQTRKENLLPFSPLANGRKLSNIIAQ